MAKALYKVQKQISKKRVGKGSALHVNSRDAQRLRAAGAREDKLSKLVTAANRANQSYGRRHGNLRVVFIDIEFEQ
jgi:translation machinery-associated protein 16